MGNLNVVCCITTMIQQKQDKKEGAKYASKHTSNTLCCTLIISARNTEKEKTILFESRLLLG